MAETVSPEMNCVYVDTNLDTHLLILLHDHETISDFKEKLCKEHHQCFPKLGEIDILAVKVKRQNTLGLFLDYHLPDSMCLSMAFEGISSSCWFVFVEATVRIVEEEEPRELLEKDNDVGTHSLLLDVYSKNQNLEQDLEAEKRTKKRKLKLSHGEKSRKKPKVYLSQCGASTASASASGFDVDESHGNVQVDVIASQSSPREKLDDEALTEARGKEIEMGEYSVEDAGIETVSHPATETGLTARPDTEKKRSKDDINQSSAAAAITTSSDIVNDTYGVPTNVGPLDATPQSLPTSGGENLDVLFAEPSQKDNEMVEINQSVAAITTSSDIVNETIANVDPLDATLPIPGAENLDAEASQKGNEMGDNPINDVGRDQTDTDNHLDTNSELAARPDTDKKEISKDDISQSSAAALTTSRDIVNEINGVPANVDPVDATPPTPRAENLDSLFAEANQKDLDDDVGRDQSATDNLASLTADHLDTNSELTTRPDTEKKKKRRKKRSKDDISQSSAAAITTSRDIVNEINEVPTNVDATPEFLPISRGTPSAESSQKENEMAEKFVEDVGRGNTETNSGLVTTRPDTEKKKRRKKSSKGDMNQFFVAPRASGVIVNEINGVPGNEDPDGATDRESLSISRRENLGIPSAEETSHKETETGEKIDDVVGGGKAVPSDVEIDADEAKSVKPTKKIKSKKAKRPAEEDTLGKKKTKEDVEKTGKKSCKKSKKKCSLKVADSQELSVEVNNAALEEVL